MAQTFFFYDLETSGLSPREDRIMQFAGQRTDLDFEPIGEPVNLLVKMTDDTLPSPGAIATTGITPQSTQADGLTEAELCKYLMTEIFVPGTIALGYNSVRFDDEFMRHLFWRNFYDPYEWQWKDDRGRWDMLDVVRLTRALRPEGINWPVSESGKATNRLELLTKLNGISHEAAHDALSDVTALIDVTRLIRKNQPQLYNFLFKMKSKKAVQQLVNLDNKKPFVYASGRYSAEFDKTTVAFPLTAGRNGNVVVFDLRYNVEELLEKNEPDESSRGRSSRPSSRGSSLRPRSDCGCPREDQSVSLFPKVKELCYNKCPAVAPIGVLDKDDGWKKIGLDKETIDKNLKILLKHPEFAEQVREKIENKPEWPEAIDAESALYDGFLPDPDRVRCNAVRNADANDLADFHPEFLDERLPELLLHYKAKNFPSSLTEAENIKWERYRTERLSRQAPGFLKGLEKMQEEGGDSFLIEELSLWYQSLLPGEY